MRNDAWLLLAAAILEQAAEDYKAALRTNRQDIIKEIETFYISDFGQILSDYNGEQIIQRLRKEPDRPHPRRDFTHDRTEGGPQNYPPRANMRDFWKIARKEAKARED